MCVCVCVCVCVSQPLIKEICAKNVMPNRLSGFASDYFSYLIWFPDQGLINFQTLNLKPRQFKQPDIFSNKQNKLKKRPNIGTQIWAKKGPPQHVKLGEEDGPVSIETRQRERYDVIIWHLATQRQQVWLNIASSVCKVERREHLNVRTGG